MKTLKEINEHIKKVAFANDYPDLVKKYGYVFHAVCNIDAVKFFEINHKQIIIDFRLNCLYLCENYEVITIAMPIKSKLMNIIVGLYNGNCNTGSFETPQKHRIARIVNLCYSYAIISPVHFF